MIDMERVSIIVPVYNVKDYLERAVESLMIQTYRNIEIILIDDGSSDGSSEICDKFKKKDERIKVLHKKNEGVSVARNIGLKYSTGGMITFLDSDDYAEPSMIMTLVQSMKQNNADIVCCGYNLVDVQGKKLRKQCSYNYVGKACGNEIFYNLIDDFFYTTSVWNKIFKRSVVFTTKDEFTEFERGLTVGEDELWLLKIISVGNPKGVFISDRLYNWVQRYGSATHSDFSLTQQRMDQLHTREFVHQHMLKVGNDIYLSASGYLLFEVAYALWKIALKGDDIEVKKRIEQDFRSTIMLWFGNRHTTLIKKLKVLLSILRSKFTWH